MANVEPVVLQQDKIKIRHIGPKAEVWPGAPVSVKEYTVLARSDMVARELPSSGLPTSPDFVSGSWTGRLGDAGEASLTFPNGLSSDGVAWRERFSTDGHRQWIEIYFNGELDFVGVIDRLSVDRQKVTVHAYDGSWLLKKAYVRDSIVTMAPRDVIDRGTRVWVPTTVDNFPPGSTITGTTLTTPTGAWTLAAGTTVLAAGGGITLGSGITIVESPVVTLGSPSAAWSCVGSFTGNSLGGAGTNIDLEVRESSGDVYGIQCYEGVAQLFAIPNGGSSSDYGQTTILTATTYSFLVECDGQWVWAFANGTLAGCMRRLSSSASTSLETVVEVNGTVATLTSVRTESEQPFLMQ